MNQKRRDVTDVVREYYSRGGEEERLSYDQWQVERLRTEGILKRFLPKPPATIVDVGGGAGAYALPLARQGYDVYLIDLVPLHIEQAKKAAQKQKEYPLKAYIVGDARQIELENDLADVVLLFGPLYHLPDKKDRFKVLSEAFRILKRGGLVFSVGISRYASFLNGIITGFLKDPAFVKIVQQDLKTGHHENPTGLPEYFTTAYFHRPDELKVELQRVGFKDISLLSVEGPAWIMPNFEARWNDKELQHTLLPLLALMEKDSSILGMSAHILAIGQK